MRLLLLACVLMLFSCGPYSGYDSVGEDYQRIFRIGDDDYKIASSDNVSIYYQILTTDGDVLLDYSDTRMEPFTLYNIGDATYLERLLTGTVVGDSISIITNHQNVVSDSIQMVLKCPEKVMFNFVVVGKEQRKFYLARLEAREKARILREEAAQVFRAYRDSIKLDPKTFKYGVYFKTIKEGTGAYIRNGDLLSVHYTGTFLGGKKFDDTRKSGEPFVFTKGTPDQVLPGFNIGLEMMKKGTIAEIIIPSDLGFGEKGSSTGIIPPFATLVYNVEVVDVN